MNRILVLSLLIWVNFFMPALAQSTVKPAERAPAEQLKSDAPNDSTVSQYVSETGGMSIEELVKLMLSGNKKLEAAREQLHQAEARLVQAQLRPNPSFDIERTTDVLFRNEGEGGYSFSFSQPFELGGKRSKRIRVAQTSIALTKAQIADEERQLSTQMRTLMGEALASAAKLELLERLKGLNQQMAGVMEVRLRTGDAARLDANLLRAATNQFEAQRLQADSRVAGLLLEIKTLAGISPNEPLLLRSGFQAPDIALTREAAWAAAQANRPDLQAARLREELAETDVVLAKAQAAPTPRAFVRYTKETLLIQGLLPPAERIVHTDSVVSFGVSVPLALFNRQQGNIAEAVSIRAQARAEREWLERLIQRDILLAHRRLETARRSLDVLNRGVLTESQESFQIVRLAYELGDLRLLDVVNQERLFIEAQMSYVEAQKEYYTAGVDLERAMGKEFTR